MLDLSPVKILMVLIVALIVLGPDKLPVVARQLGAGWGSLRRLRDKLESEVRESFPDLPSTQQVAQVVRSPLSFLDQLADAHEREEASKAMAADADDPPIVAPVDDLDPPLSVSSGLPFDAAGSEPHEPEGDETRTAVPRLREDQVASPSLPATAPVMANGAASTNGTSATGLPAVGGRRPGSPRVDEHLVQLADDPSLN